MQWARPGLTVAHPAQDPKLTVSGRKKYIVWNVRDIGVMVTPPSSLVGDLSPAALDHRRSHATHVPRGWHNTPFITNRLVDTPPTGNPVTASPGSLGLSPVTNEEIEYLSASACNTSHEDVGRVFPRHCHDSGDARSSLQTGSDFTTNVVL